MNKPSTQSPGLGIGVVLLAGLLLGFCPSGAHSQANNSCGDLRNGYGPFDYRKDKTKLPIVEDSHFTPPVEALLRGVSGPIGAELDYTLRAFPNHHRALMAMIRLSVKAKTVKPAGALYTVECYLDRAVRFAPDDTVVRLIFARHLGQTGQKEQALNQMSVAVKQAGDNPLSHFNIGLIYIELGQYEEALTQAHQLIAMDYERPELRKQLEEAGKWRDPPP